MRSLRSPAVRAVPSGALALSPAQGGQVPAIALTAYAGQGTQQRALAAGFDRHVAKPIDPDALAEVVVRLLEAASASDRASAAG